LVIISTDELKPKLQKILGDDDCKLLHLWLAYRRFIGNSDAHNGNVSFFFKDLTLAGLTSAYDISPMRYIPKQLDNAYQVGRHLCRQC
jgi:hypothetical protein